MGNNMEAGKRSQVRFGLTGAKTEIVQGLSPSTALNVYAT